MVTVKARSAPRPGSFEHGKATSGCPRCFIGLLQTNVGVDAPRVYAREVMERPNR
jgi:hypothetical protein